MPRQRPIRNLTGNHRRQSRRYIQSEYRHVRGLNAFQVRYRAALQNHMLLFGRTRSFLLTRIGVYFIALLQTNCALEHDMLNREIDFLFSTLDHTIQPLEMYYTRQEFLLCDIDPRIDEPHTYGQPRNRTINEFEGYACEYYTTFTKEELRRIYDCFFLPATTRIHNSGNHFYCFTGEELFLFMITKAVRGWSNTDLCINVFGGSSRRFSNGYKWMLLRTHRRYKKVTNIEGLSRYVPEFPQYAKAICKKFNEERYYVDRATNTVFPVQSITVDPEHFNICGFMDGSANETTTAGSGPEGDYKGCRRKDNWYFEQRSIYSGYKKQHGLTVLTLLLPNGLNFVYGPCALRCSDNTMVNAARIDDFLVSIQIQWFEYMYKFYGDRLFALGRAISRAHKPQPGAILTLIETLENQGMNVCREAIEHSYSVIANKFAICENYREFKLKEEHPHAMEQLWLCYFLSNISVCLHGSQVGAARTFGCAPPTLEEYLNLN